MGIEELANDLTYISLFSGIGGFDIGLERAGWRCLAQVEIDPFCNDVLEARFPDVPRFPDVTTFGAGSLRDLARRRDEGRSVADAGTGREGRGAKARRRNRDTAGGELLGDESSAVSGDGPRVDLICGGFPCQDLSVAGRRAGLHASRSGLFFEFVRVAREIRPRWLLVENVPGLFSSPSERPGEDFGIVLSELGDAGYFVEGRVLDSRWFGVPQRRRRVFLVGHLGGAPARSVLIESEGGGGDPATGDPSRQDVAGTLGLGTPGSRGVRTTDLDGSGAYIVSAMTSKWRKGTGGPAGDETQNLVLANTLQKGVRHRPGSSADETESLVIAPRLAAPLSAGAHPNSNAPSRRMEDDVNLVVANPLRRSDGFDSEDGTGRQPALVIRTTGNEHSIGTDEAMGWQSSRDQGHNVAVLFRKSARVNADPTSPETWVEDDISNTLNTFDTGDVRTTELVAAEGVESVRRLTVIECERLQGFPDGWTAHDGEGVYAPKYAWRARPNRHDRRKGRTLRAFFGRKRAAFAGWRLVRGTPDGPRYGALGNAVTVNVAEWIAVRMRAASYPRGAAE